MNKHVSHINKMDLLKQQTVLEHSCKAADMAYQFLSPLGFGATARLVMLLHDSGKAREAFSDYILKGAYQKGQVIHTFQGGRYLMEKHHDTQNGAECCASEILATVIWSHHGLIDCIGPSWDGVKDGIVHRMSDVRVGGVGLGYAETLRSMSCIQDEIETLYDLSVKELFDVLQGLQALLKPRLNPAPNQICGEFSFYTGLLMRLILSAVVDADRRDAAEFVSDAVYPPVLSRLERQKLWQDSLQNVESYIVAMDHESNIGKARAAISDMCREAAEIVPGLFYLQVPVGGGKTLSGLRFALAHALKYDMERIVLVSPRLSIIEQNADVVRRAVRNDAAILEHHSNAVDSRDESDDYHDADDNHYMRLVENWGAPIVVTTSVQFLNALFSGSLTAARRMHALSRSVIILDEVQTVPDNQLTLFSLAVNFLVHVCKSTVVFCSATQPNLREIRHSVCVPIQKSISVSVTAFNGVFHRADIVPPDRDVVVNENDVAQRALSLLDEFGSVLIVTNTKAQAALIFKTVCDTSAGSDAVTYHFSASMCEQHRKAVLTRMKTDLSLHKRVICCATRAIEAGVDISFGAGLTFEAGFDSVMQVLGRINRSHELGPGRVGKLYVVKWYKEDLTKLPDMQLGRRATEELFEVFSSNPDRFGNDIQSEDAVRYYYNKLYQLEGDNNPDYRLGKDSESIYDLLSLNTKYYCSTKAKANAGLHMIMRQAFRTAGSEYKVFDSRGISVIVPYGDGTKVIADLCSERAQCDVKFLRKTLRRAAGYSVSVFESQFKKLCGEGVIKLLSCGAYALVDGYYDCDALGLTLDGTGVGGIADFV